MCVDGSNDAKNMRPARWATFILRSQARLKEAVSLHDSMRAADASNVAEGSRPVCRFAAGVADVARGVSLACSIVPKPLQTQAAYARCGDA